MVPVGLILDFLGKQLNDPRPTSDPEWRQILLTMLNIVYQDICSMNDWQTLRRIVSIASPYRMPSDMLRISFVRDADDNVFNYNANKETKSMWLRSWFFDTPVISALATGTTVTVQELATAVTSDAEFPSTTCVGEYIVIGANPGIYEIASWTSTSAITLTDRFRGNSLGGVAFEIRPVSTQILGFCNQNGTALTPDSVNVSYTKKPLPLHLDTDQILLPGDCSAVRTKTLQMLLAMLAKPRAAERLDGQFKSDLAKMKMLEQRDARIAPTSIFVSRQLNPRPVGDYSWARPD